ncbi:MAG TPA: alpha/beta hydrolase [Ktedonobacteraceae bacterium]|nr:alpha/beta hydrolase [Ktedonobacteraceae bacterium]
MKNFWRRHTGLRRSSYRALFLFFLLIGALLYLAYIYMPSEERASTPAYLRWMQAQHLDGYADAGNFRLHYLHEGSGEPVVLLPGGGGWIYDMRDIITALAPHYSVYAVDPPGDGYTTPIVQNPDYNSIYTLDSINQSLLAFLNALHIPRAAFIGNSWGGGYALYFTETHPERVIKYVSLDGTGLNLPDNWEWELAKWPVLGEVEMKLTATPTYIRQTLEQLYAPRKVNDDMVQEYAIPYSFHVNLISQWVLERNLHWSVTERLLPQVKTPILVIWGKQDDILDSNLYLPRWRKYDPHATIVEIDQASHTVHDSQPEQVNRLLLSFLAPL